MSRLFRTLAGVVCALALAMGGLLATGSTASAADTPRHVTKAEFHKVRKGMSMQRAHRIFDIRGKQSWFMAGHPGRWGWPAEQARDYRVKSRWGYVMLTFKKRQGVWRLTDKSAYWG